MKFRNVPIGDLIYGESLRDGADEELGELMESLGRFEMIQPILVVPVDGKYEIVSGHRRYNAMKARNEPDVPCIIRDDLSRRDLPFVRVVENVQRKNLSPHELVKVFDEMRAARPGITDGAIAKMLGKSSTWVSLKYRAEKIFQELAAEGVPSEDILDMNESALLRLGKIKDPEARKRFAAGGARGQTERRKRGRPRIYELKEHQESATRNVIFQQNAAGCLEYGFDEDTGELGPLRAKDIEYARVLLDAIFTEDVLQMLEDDGYNTATIRFSVGRREGWNDDEE